MALGGYRMGLLAGNLHFSEVFVGVLSRNRAFSPGFWGPGWGLGEWARRPGAEIAVLVAVGEGRMGGGKAESSNPLSHSLVAPNKGG